MKMKDFERFVKTHKHKDLILKGVLPSLPFELSILRIANNVGYKIPKGRRMNDILDDLWLYIYTLKEYNSNYSIDNILIEDKKDI